MFDDPYEADERGLKHLDHMLRKNHPAYNEFQTLARRLRDSIYSLRIYGSSQEASRGRYEIIKTLNIFAHEHVGQWFDSLCVPDAESMLPELSSELYNEIKSLLENSLVWRVMTAKDCIEWLFFIELQNYPSELDLTANYSPNRLIDELLPVMWYRFSDLIIFLDGLINRAESITPSDERHRNLYSVEANKFIEIIHRLVRSEKLFLENLITSINSQIDLPFACKAEKLPNELRNHILFLDPVVTRRNFGDDKIISIENFTSIIETDQIQIDTKELSRGMFVFAKSDMGKSTTRFHMADRIRAANPTTLVVEIDTAQLNLADSFYFLLFQNILVELQKRSGNQEYHLNHTIQLQEDINELYFDKINQILHDTTFNQIFLLIDQISNGSDSISHDRQRIFIDLLDTEIWNMMHQYCRYCIFADSYFERDIKSNLNDMTSIDFYYIERWHDDMLRKMADSRLMWIAQQIVPKIRISINDLFINNRTAELANLYIKADGAPGKFIELLREEFQQYHIQMQEGNDILELIKTARH